MGCEILLNVPRVKSVTKMVRKWISIILMFAIAIAICMAQVAVFVTAFTIYSPSKLTFSTVMSNLLPQIRSRPYYWGGYLGDLFWDDAFVSGYSRVPRAPNQIEQRAIDPETGLASKRVLDWNHPVVPWQLDFSSKCWLLRRTRADGAVATNDNQLASLELRGQQTFESTFQPPYPPALPGISGAPDESSSRFLINGQPAYGYWSASGYRVFQYEGADWDQGSDLELPDELSSNQLKYTLKIRYFSFEDRVHVFVALPHIVYYREGLTLRRPGIAGVPDIVEEVGVPASKQDRQRQHDEWMSLVVSEEPTKDAPLEEWKHPQAALINGEPIITAVGPSDSNTAQFELKVYRLTGSDWTLACSRVLPLNTYALRVGTTPNGARAYVLATTRLGWTHTFAIESSGIRRTRGDTTVVDFKLPNLPLHLLAILSSSFFLGSAFGMALWGLMWWAGNPLLKTQKCDVRLASMARRGTARSLDLSLLFIGASLITFLMLYKFDWYDFMEAVQSRISHETIDWIILTVFFLFLWTVAWTFIQAALQVRCGSTFGKWCCGLTTTRTTLEKLRFPRALLREILFYLDICYGISFVPAVLLIGLTPKRQRLGDLLAGTIVVESKSLPVHALAQVNSAGDGEWA